MPFLKYLESIDDYEKSVTEAHEVFQRSEPGRGPQSVLDPNAEIEALKSRTRDFEKTYQAVAEKFHNLINVDVRIPARVRPVDTHLSLDDVAKKHKEAIDLLNAAITTYQQSSRDTARASAEAATALANRQRALGKQDQRKPARQAAPETKNEASNTPKKAAKETNGSQKRHSVSHETKTNWLNKLGQGLRDLFHSGSGEQASKPNSPPVTPKSPKKLTGASEPGTLTGYEPKALETVEIPKTPLMHGTPGSGLDHSGFNDRAVRLGQLGELNFAKALAKEGLLKQFATFWSVHMLDQDTYGKTEADVDCAIITGHTIWLVDVKYYTGGSVLYRLDQENKLICVDVPTGQHIGKPRYMSKNMKMAIERFTSRYKNYQNLHLEARVVFVPTNAGIGQIDQVRWPGNIPAVYLPDFLEELKTQPPFEDTLESDLVRRTFQGLIK